MLPNSIKVPIKVVDRTNIFRQVLKKDLALQKLQKELMKQGHKMRRNGIQKTTGPEEERERT